MMKRALILVMTGFCCFPAVASAEEMITEQGAATVERVSLVAEPAVIIEDLLEAFEDAETSRSYTFTGNANEMIVISVEPSSGYESVAVYAESVS